MTRAQYSKAVRLSEKPEIIKAVLVAYYLYKVRNQDVFPMPLLVNEMLDFGLNIPNQSRLRSRIVKHKSFAKATGANMFRLSLREKESLEKHYPTVGVESEEIDAEELILPHELFRGTRGYVESVAKQINASYQHNLFDGCAMLMRRLLEMLIILSYKHASREQEIKDSDGHFRPLSYLINHSLSKRVLGLSKDSENMLDEFRQLGNYSAHGIEYSCKRADLKRVKIHYRACMEELLYKAGLRT